MPDRSEAIAIAHPCRTEALDQPGFHSARGPTAASSRLRGSGTNVSIHQARCQDRPRPTRR